MFADKVEIFIQAGKGGDGKLSFLHEKYRARGGADGGDGGRGGNVVAEVNHNVNTLSFYRTNRRITAQDGQGGGGNEKAGRAGEDIIIKAPVGTSIYSQSSDPITGEKGEKVLIADLASDGQRVVLAKGGRGGYGNGHFQSSVRQAPRIAEVGEPGESFNIIMELKLVADIGLVGLPNAGKSTLLSVITNAKPEIGDYPFTTLIPNLGVVDMDDFSFLVADIPGLIEGASEGKGLGDEFLRHIERTAIVFHLVDANSDDVGRDYKVIQNELKSYEVDLTSKPQLVVLTKIESIQSEDVIIKAKALAKASKQEVFQISAIAHKGLDQLLRAAIPFVRKARDEAEAAREEAALLVVDETTLEIPWKTQQLEEGLFEVTGTRIEGFAKRTNYQLDEGVRRLRNILGKMGIARELEKRGCKSGDTVRIAGHDIRWL